MSNNDFRDVLGVLEHTTPSCDDGWEFVMAGEESRRPSTLKRIAETKVEVELTTKENFEALIAILRESDARLAAVPDDRVQYEWQFVCRKGLTLRFGVTWFDKAFFESRKDAYLSDMHQSLLASVGLRPENMTVRHIDLDASK